MLTLHVSYASWVHIMGNVEVRVMYTYSGVLPFVVFFKDANSAGPIPPVLYFTDQVWTGHGAMSGRFVRALRWVQGTCFISGALWGLIKVVAG